MFQGSTHVRLASGLHENTNARLDPNLPATLSAQDAKMFRRKRWRYLILDEAHLIKNWRSMRWQTLLNFNSKRRLLITGGCRDCRVAPWQLAPQS